ncbi:MAG: EamA family transporter [Planctomycetaceae bacterium]
MTHPSHLWLIWAVLSACFAALTAIFGKIGVQKIDPDFATLLRTAMVLAVLLVLVLATGKWRDPRQLSGHTIAFLSLSALATGASWVCYFRALQLGKAYQVAPIDKFSVVLVTVFAVAFLGERPSSGDWIGLALVTSGLLVLAMRR